jgi:hypothetical protein
MAISERRLPGEPGGDELTAWLASRPRPEPARRERGLDTMPAEPAIDWALVIRGAILGERAHMTEAIGGAIAEYGNGIIDEIETMIAATADQLREEFSRQLEQLRDEFSGRIDELANESAGNVALIHSQGEKLKAQLDEIVARKKRAKGAKTNGSAPNGNGGDVLPLADASLAQRYEHGQQ